MNKQEVINDFEQSLQKAEDILNREQPRISESAVDRIFGENFSINNLITRLKNFSKRKPYELYNDGDLDLTKLSYKELLQCKILRFKDDNSIKILKNNYPVWRNVFGGFICSGIFGLTLITPVPFIAIGFLIVGVKLFTSAISNAISNSRESEANTADLTIGKNIGKTNILAEFIADKNGNIIPIIYSNDFNALGSFQSNRYVKSTKRYLEKYLDKDQVEFSRLLNDNWTDSLIEIKRLGCYFNNFENFDWFIKINPSLVKHRKNLEGIILHEVGHLEQYRKNHNLILEGSDVILDAKKELYADLNILKEYKWNILEYVTFLVSENILPNGLNDIVKGNQEIKIQTDENGESFINYILPEIGFKSLKEIKPNQALRLRCTFIDEFDPHAFARNYILIHFNELKKNGFNMPKELEKIK